MYDIIIVFISYYWRIEHKPVSADVRLGRLAVTPFPAPTAGPYICLSMNISRTHRVECHSDYRDPHGITVVGQDQKFGVSPGRSDESQHSAMLR